MTEATVLLERHGAMAVLRLNRPEKLNALNAAMLSALVGHLRALDADPTLRATVILGGPRAFAAGADIGTLAAASPVELLSSGFSDHWDAVAAIRHPLIAAVSGYALGGGLELALACDILICDETAVFGLPETSIGTIPGAGGTQRLTRSLGKSLAMEITLAGRRLTGAEALATGLASTLCPKAELEGTALALAGRIATQGPLAVGMAKQLLLQGQDMPLAAGIQLERSLACLLAASEDRAEGMRAFAEKRRPVFTGR